MNEENTKLVSLQLQNFVQILIKQASLSLD